MVFRTLSPWLERLCGALEVYRTGRLLTSVALPVQLADRANGRSASSRLAGSRKAKALRTAARLALATTRGTVLAALMAGRPPVVVRLVRVSPRCLDDDNLASALKPVRDGVAEALGVDDGDPALVWLPDWERSSRPRAHSVRVEVYSVVASRWLTP